MKIPNKFDIPQDPLKLLNLPANASIQDQTIKIKQLRKEWHPDCFSTFNLSKEQNRFLNDRFIWLNNMKPNKQPILVGIRNDDFKATRNLKFRNRKTITILCGFIVVGMVIQYNRFYKLHQLEGEFSNRRQTFLEAEVEKMKLNKER